MTDDLTLDDFRAEVRQLDEELDPNEEGFRVAVLLLASLQVGPDPLALARFTGENAEWVAMIGERLRESHIWAGDKIQANWFDDDAGGIEFWLDVNVGLGLIEKRPAEDADGGAPSKPKASDTR